MFDKVCGTDEVRKAFTKSFRVSDIMGLWTNDIPGIQENGNEILPLRIAYGR